MKLSSLALPVLALCFLSAKADTAYVFNLTGSGITSSGTLSVSQVGTKYEITGITGTFSDSVSGGFTGNISGLLPGSYDPVNYSSSPGGNSNYDNLFYPTGSAPSACGGTVPSAAKLDYCGVAFSVSANATTYYVNLYGNGVNSNSSYLALDYPSGGSDIQSDVPVALTFTAVTPEPSTWLMTGTGMLAAAFLLQRRSRRA